MFRRLTILIGITAVLTVVLHQQLAKNEYYYFFGQSTGNSAPYVAQQLQIFGWCCIKDPSPFPDQALERCNGYYSTEKACKKGYEDFYTGLRVKGVWFGKSHRGGVAYSACYDGCPVHLAADLSEKKREKLTARAEKKEEKRTEKAIKKATKRMLQAIKKAEKIIARAAKKAESLAKKNERRISKGREPIQPKTQPPELLAQGICVCGAGTPEANGRYQKHKTRCSWNLADPEVPSRYSMLYTVEPGRNTPELGRAMFHLNYASDFLYRTQLDQQFDVAECPNPADLAQQPWEKSEHAKDSIDPQGPVILPYTGEVCCGTENAIDSLPEPDPENYQGACCLEVDAVQGMYCVDNYPEALCNVTTESVRWVSDFETCGNVCVQDFYAGQPEIGICCDTDGAQCLEGLTRDECLGEEVQGDAFYPGMDSCTTACGVATSSQSSSYISAASALANSQQSQSLETPAAPAVPHTSSRSSVAPISSVSPEDDGAPERGVDTPSSQVSSAPLHAAAPAASATSVADEERKPTILRKSKETDHIEEEEVKIYFQEEEGATFCEPLFEDRQYEEKADAVNIVFKFPGYGNPENKYEKAQTLANALMQLEPFNEPRQQVKFQFWKYTRPIKITGRSDAFTSCYDLCKNEVACPGLPNVGYVDLCRLTCAPTSSLGEYAGHTNGITVLPQRVTPAFFAHAFGHMFGGRIDEYVDEYCIDERGRACEGDNCYACIPHSYEPHDHSVMRDYTSTEHGYGERNIIQFKRKLASYSGRKFSDLIQRTRTTLQNAEHPFLQFLGQLIELDEEPTQGSSSSETALRVTMKRNNNGDFDVDSVIPTNAPFGIKPSFENGNVVKVRIGDKIFSQTFSATDILVTELFNADEAEFHEYREKELETVAVYVGLGDEVHVDDNLIVLEDGRRFAYDIEVESCDSRDEDDDNNCPQPMFHGSIIEEFNYIEPSLHLSPIADPNASPTDDVETVVSAVNLYFSAFVIVFLIWLLGVLYFVNERKKKPIYVEEGVEESK